jgi:hypothetical protein
LSVEAVRQGESVDEPEGFASTEQVGVKFRQLAIHDSVSTERYEGEGYG